MSKDFNSHSSDTFVSLLTLLFIYLKLTNQIDWSWWWVLSPIWISVTIIIAIVLIVLGLALVAKKGD